MGYNSIYNIQFTMKLIFAIFLAIISIVNAGDYPIEDDVIVLGDDNFDDAIAEHKNILVEFYAPWCGHCKSLAPEYAKAAKTLADSPVKLAKVDATEAKELATRFEIKGFPTLKFFKNGKASEYGGGRTEPEIVTWLNKKTGPPAKTIANKDQLLKLQEANDFLALGVFSSEDSDAAKAFLSMAADDEVNTYAITTAESVKTHLKVKKDTLIVLRTFDEPRLEAPLTKATTAEEIGAFVMGNSVPLVQEFSPESSKRIFGSPIQNHVLFFTDKEADHHEPTMEKFRSVAGNFKGGAMFVNVPSTESKVLEFFGVTEDEIPKAVLADLSSPSGIKKYVFEGDISSESEIKGFVTSFFEGELTPSLKSEEVLPEDTEGDVIVLKGKSFKELVLDNDKDVLVEFYAPWCGHCKKLAPIWDELAATYKENENVVIAKMDSTANEIDVEGVAVRGFPTIYFFKGGEGNKSKPMKYEQGREFNSFIAFLEENAHHPVTHEEL